MKSAVLFALFAFACTAGEWKTTVPFTYNIEYGPEHVGSEKYLKTIGEAPPDFLHVGEDLPFSSTFGTKRDYAGVKADLFKLLTVEEVRAKIAELRAYTASLHKAGVKWVIPYICNELAFGDHVRRAGFFEFFDHWDRYAEFGYPPKPDADILLARKFYPFQGIRRGRNEDGFRPFKVYSMCTNNPQWRAHLLAATANAARCGYDGIFVDVMTLHDYCPHCQRLFREYLAKKYPPAERNRRFGVGGVDRISLGVQGDGALWAETQAFWGDSSTGLLESVAAEGRKTNPKFFAVPNLGPVAHADGVQKRVREGMNPFAWARATDLMLVEEMQRPGHVLGGYIMHNILQYKLAFAAGFRAGMLLYNAQDPTGIELAMAEAGAGGGGALIQGGYKAPASRRKYRRFFEQHRSLYDGYNSVAQVAVVFDYNQLYWLSRSNLQAAYRLVDYLSERHILFDLVTPAQAASGKLARYQAVITPSLKYLSAGALAALRRYSASGGVWVDTGDSGRFSDAGDVRATPSGARLAFGDLDELIAYPRFAVYLMKEDDANEISEITATLKAVLEGENPLPPSRVKRDLQTLLEEHTKRPLAVISGKGFDAVRVTAYRHRGAGGETVVAHFVNYNCQVPLDSKEAWNLAPQPARQIRVRLPVSGATGARLIDPDGAPSQPLSFIRKDGAVEFTLPEVKIYKVVEITGVPASAR
jgi:hypothetical protein